MDIDVKDFVVYNSIHRAKATSGNLPISLIDYFGFVYNLFE